MDSGKPSFRKWKHFCNSVMMMLEALGTVSELTGKNYGFSSCLFDEKALWVCHVHGSSYQLS